MDGLHCLDIILFLTASIWEFLEVVGDPSLEGVECKGVVAPVLDGKASLFLAEENPLGLGEQKGDVAGAIPAVKLDQLHDVGFIRLIHVHDDVIGA